jgi:hypothetical protein
MWLVTTLMAAIIVTAAWYFTKRDYRLDLLSLKGLITNATLLGIVMLIPIFIVWEIILILTKPKVKIEIGGN